MGRLVLAIPYFVVTTSLLFRKARYLLCKFYYIALQFVFHHQSAIVALPHSYSTESLASFPSIDCRSQVNLKMAVLLVHNNTSSLSSCFSACQLFLLFHVSMFI